MSVCISGGFKLFKACVSVLQAPKQPREQLFPFLTPSLLRDEALSRLGAMVGTSDARVCVKSMYTCRRLVELFRMMPRTSPERAVTRRSV